jgi:hypothetical protein
MEQQLLNIQKDWGLFSPQANQAFYRKAQSLVKKLEKATASRANHLKILNIFMVYFKSYQRSCKSYDEASDTAVREEVWGFALSMAKLNGVSYDELDKLWEERYR